MCIPQLTNKVYAMARENRRKGYVEALLIHLVALPKADYYASNILMVFFLIYLR